MNEATTQDPSNAKEAVGVNQHPYNLLEKGIGLTGKPLTERQRKALHRRGITIASSNAVLTPCHTCYSGIVPAYRYPYGTRCSRCIGQGK